jgi:hypothetical protein
MPEKPFRINDGDSTVIDRRYRTPSRLQKILAGHKLRKQRGGRTKPVCASRLPRKKINPRRYRENLGALAPWR